VTRAAAIEHATHHFDSGSFFSELSRRIAVRTESRNPDRAGALAEYLDGEISGAATALGCTVHTVENPAGGGPFLLGHRHEGAARPTVLVYGHGDVVDGDESRWSEGLSPWRLEAVGTRWYGRGTADNKGQHSINLAALRSVLQTRGRLGFNLKILMETGEEVGSPGLREVCRTRRDELAADLLIASDGPRFAAGYPTIFLGSRGAAHFSLHVRRAGGPRHSGNWGGVLSNPATRLANALSALVDARGRLLVEELRPPQIPDGVLRALDGLVLHTEPGDPAIDEEWGEPGLTPVQKLFAWNTLEVLAMGAADPAAPMSAVPDHAVAHCQLRFVAGTDWERLVEILRRHLDRTGFADVEVVPAAGGGATRLDPGHPWATWARDSIRHTTGAEPTVLPNFGGTLPNAVFVEELGLPTIWVPHSYPGCAQHAPDEHLLEPVVREGLQIMTGLFWDLGELPDRPGGSE
jgi:acetylornithine deacetylase/succinyl-diaminopimelate desuccinylase-like protein